MYQMYLLTRSLYPKGNLPGPFNHILLTAETIKLDFLMEFRFLLYT